MVSTSFARLRSAFPRVEGVRAPPRLDLRLRLIFVAIGATPILSLALSLLEVVPLHRSAPVALGLAVLVSAGIMAVEPGLREMVGRGLGCGLTAVLLYDCTRLPFVVFGGWPDFIPEIGAWLLNRPQAHWTVGYGWRYLGNGAGMGLVFEMIAPWLNPWLSRQQAGVLYGLVIWSGLISTLLIAPDGQEKMFVLTPLTLALSLTGHIVYGGVLGAARRGPRPPLR